MEGLWVILARVLRVAPAQAVVVEAGDPTQVEEHAAVGEAEGAAVAAAEEAAADEAEVAEHAPALHAVVGPQAEQAALEESEHAEVVAEGAAVLAGLEALHAVVGSQAEEAEHAEVAAQGAAAHMVLEAPHAVLEPQAEQVAVEEAEHAEVAANAGLEAPHAVVGLQAQLEQRITDIDRAAAEAAAAVAEAAQEGHDAAQPDFSITVAPPARVTFLTAGNTSHPNPAKPDMFPYIVAAGSFCLLARYSTHPYRGTNFNVRPRASNHVVVRHFRNGANGQIVATAERVPRRTRGIPKLNHVEGVGLLCNDNDHTYRIAELRVVNNRHLRHFHTAVLVYFRSGSGGWFKRTLDVPEALRRDCDRAWVPHGTVAVANTLMWYDLSWGLLTFDRKGALVFYGLPPARALDRLDSTANIHATRCIGHSGNFVRYVEIMEPNNPQEATVSMWYRILVGDKDDGWQWLPNYSVSFEDIWNNASYIATGLPQNTVPDLVCISPVNPSVIYFSLGQRLFAVDVPNHVVLECENFELVDVPQQPRQASGRFIVPWNLNPGIAQDNVGHVPQVYVTLPEDVSDDEVVQEQDREVQSQTTTAWDCRGSKSVTITPMKVRRHSVILQKKTPFCSRSVTGAISRHASGRLVM